VTVLDPLTEDEDEEMNGQQSLKEDEGDDKDEEGS